MRESARSSAAPVAASLAAVLAGLLAGRPGLAGETLASGVAAPEPAAVNLPESLRVTSASREPLNLLLTRDELRSLVSAYEARTGEVLTAPIDDEEIVVTAPAEQVPMRDLSQDVPGGIAAPFWALMHPKNAWRIFVPIPPKEDARPAERPAPDPR